MIKMIVADDEPIITKGIQKLIDWKQLGIEIIGEYADGSSALRGLLSMNPDIALLDISMPYKSGIDIIKEVRALGLKTQVIFMSGFQEFAYVREALSNGAVEYLLKPIKKDELLKTIHRCVKTCQGQSQVEEGQVYHKGEDESILPQKVMHHLAERVDTNYKIVLFDLLISKHLSEEEERLIKFSVATLIDHNVSERNKGILFNKESYIVVVLEGGTEAEAKEFILELIRKVYEQTYNRIGAILAEQVEEMSQIPMAFEQCVKHLGYLFFSELIGTPLITVGKPVFLRHFTVEQLIEYRRRTIDHLFSGTDKEWLLEYEQYAKIIGILADGCRDDAWFYLNATVRLIEERFEELNISTGDLQMKDILEQGRSTKSYRAMTDLYQQLFEKSRQYVYEIMRKNDKIDIIRAKQYINDHYMDNLSLGVLSDYIHMNPYYFSGYFKKHAGENFKDYLNNIRMKHALKLLLSTAKKSYEIADAVGFKDHKYFSKLFQRYYGQTPTQYRKKYDKSS